MKQFFGVCVVAVLTVAVWLLSCPGEAAASGGCCDVRLYSWSNSTATDPVQTGTGEIRTDFHPDMCIMGFAKAWVGDGPWPKGNASQKRDAQALFGLYVAVPCENWMYHWDAKGFHRGEMKAMAQNDSSYTAGSFYAEFSRDLVLPDFDTAASSHDGQTSVSIGVGSGGVGGGVSWDPTGSVTGQTGVDWGQLTKEDSSAGPGPEVQVRWDGHFEVKAVRDGMDAQAHTRGWMYSNLYLSISCATQSPSPTYTTVQYQITSGDDGQQSVKRRIGQTTPSGTDWQEPEVVEPETVPGECPSPHPSYDDDDPPGWWPYEPLGPDYPSNE